MKLLAVGTDSKTVKGESKGYLTGIMYLLPNDDICPNSLNANCREGCLNTAGRGVFSNVQAARLAKTIMYTKQYSDFMLALCADIDSLIKKAKKNNMIPCIRLNGTSDIAWENKGFTDSDGIYHRNIMAKYATVQFYDYTKMPRVVKEPNYHLTFSASTNPAYAKTMAKIDRMPNPIAVVFRKVLPDTYMGRKVINGDETDLRFLDDDNVVVGLKAKGKMRKDTTSGMVVE
jgi:hypothetical protein